MKGYYYPNIQYYTHSKSTILNSKPVVSNFAPMFYYTLCIPVVQ